EIGAEGAHSLETKLRSAGLPIEDLPGPPVLPLDLSPEERSRRGRALTQAGVLGEPVGPPSRDPETVALVFDTVRRQVTPDHGLDHPLTVQWDFRDPDLETWQLRVDNGSAAAYPGAAASPDVRLRCRYDDWVDMVG